MDESVVIHNPVLCTSVANRTIDGVVHQYGCGVTEPSHIVHRFMMEWTDAPKVEADEHV